MSGQSGLAAAKNRRTKELNKQPAQKVDKLTEIPSLNVKQSFQFMWKKICMLEYILHNQEPKRVDVDVKNDAGNIPSVSLDEFNNVLSDIGNDMTSTTTKITDLTSNLNILQSSNIHMRNEISTLNDLIQTNSDNTKSIIDDLNSKIDTLKSIIQETTFKPNVAHRETLTSLIEEDEAEESGDAAGN